MEANKAEEFFAGYDKESTQSMDDLKTRRVQDMEPEVEEELVLNSVKDGPLVGNKAKNEKDKEELAGFNTSDDTSVNFVVKKDAEGVPKDGSKRNVPEKGDNKPKESSKKGHKTKRDNVRTKAKVLTGHEGGRGGL